MGVRSRYQRLMAHAAAPWVALVVLNLLLLLPAQRLPGRAGAFLEDESGWREFFVFFWLSADLLLAATVAQLISIRWSTRLAAYCGTAIVVLAGLFETYDVMIQRGFYRRPDLYNDVLMLPDLFNLSVGLLPSYWPLFLLGGLALLTMVGFAIPTALSRVAAAGRRAPARTVTIFVVGWAIVGLTQGARGLRTRDSVIQSSLLRMAESLDESLETAQAAVRLQPERLRAKAAAQFEKVPLVDPPSVYLLVSESYGAHALQSPGVQAQMSGVYEDWQRRLADAGLHMASQLSEAPVVGGQSWLSTTTLLTGIHVTGQRNYQAMTGAPSYNLSTFFQDHAYTTVTTQPGTRDRPGRPLADPFGFDHTVYAPDLDYRGDSYGWGYAPAPDQFSLHFTHDKVLKHIETPVFFFMMTLSSHLPWDNMPPLVKDYRSLQVKTRKTGGLLERTTRKIKRKLRGHKYSHADYAGAIRYQLDVLLSYVAQERRSGNVFIIIGDHQPPLVEDLKNAKTPVHIISDDPRIITALSSYGFEPGLRPTGPGTLRHEGLFSMLVGVLAQTYGPPVLAAQLPYYPKGLRHPPK